MAACSQNEEVGLQVLQRLQGGTGGSPIRDRDPVSMRIGAHPNGVHHAFVGRSMRVQDRGNSFLRRSVAHSSFMWAPQFGFLT